MLLKYYHGLVKLGKLFQNNYFFFNKILKFLTNTKLKHLELCKVWVKNKFVAQFSSFVLRVNVICVHITLKKGYNRTHFVSSV